VRLSRPSVYLWLLQTTQLIVQGVFVPNGVDGGKLVKSLRDDFGITLADGQDQWKGKVVRIANLG